MKLIYIAIVVLLVGFSFGDEFPVSDYDFDQKDCAIAFDGTNYLVVWQDTRYSTFADIYGARVDPSGNVLDPEGIPIAVATSTQWNVAIAFGDENYFVVWQDSRNGDNDNIYGARVDPLGNVLDPAGILISEDFGNHSWMPAIAFDGTNYLVVWHELRWGSVSIYGVRIDQLGNRLDAEDICISYRVAYTEQYPSVAFDGTNYFVVWQEYRTPYDYNIYGRRVSQNGQVLDPGGIPISNNPYSQQRPNVSYGGTNYFVVWGDNRNIVDIDVYGARVSSSGIVLDPEGIPISLSSGNQYSPAVASNSTHYLIVWHDTRFSDNHDIVCTIVDQVGNVLDENGIIVSAYPSAQYWPWASTDGTAFLIAWHDNRNSYDIWGRVIHPDDCLPGSLALAYNSNRHFIRSPKTEAFHVVYSTPKYVYYKCSSDQGQTWDGEVSLGQGQLPSIDLASNNEPVVAWFDVDGGLWYARELIPGHWDVYHLYDPSPYQPYLNSPPTVVVTRSLQGDTVHILVTLYLEDIEHLHGSIVEFRFPYNDPMDYDILTIEGGSAPNHKFCYNPSITKDYQERLHAVWQRGDTICYATREVSQNWNNWGWQFRDKGLQSAHPFVETYGDRVFVVWQHLETSGRDDVYRGWRYLVGGFQWQNLSQTYTTASAYPVNASGLATTFIDEEQPPPPLGEYEAYWKRIPDDQLNNISMTPQIQSIYPHTSLRYNQIADNELFVVWQEGNTAPYQIICEKVYVPDTAPAFFSSLNGTPEPSAYITKRDTFNDTWQIPADIGNSELKYRFSLEPGYVYKVTAIAYQEFGGQCKARLKVDNNLEYVVQYNSAVPKVVEAIIPPQLYADSVIEVSMQKISGAGVALGPVYVYRYEDATAGGVPGGPMAHDLSTLPGLTAEVTPTLFANEVHVELNASAQQSIKVSVYDITGRLVHTLHRGVVNGHSQLTWDCTDLNGTPVSSGIYFVRIVDLESSECRVHKVLKVR